MIKSEPAAVERFMPITDLRAGLGWAYQSVADTEQPIVIQRRGKQDVVMVPLWEWQFLKRIEAAIRDGRLPWCEVLAKLEESDAAEQDVTGRSG